MLNQKDNSKAHVTWRTGLTVAALAMVLLSGCATAGVGYSAQPVSPNRYMLSLNGATEGYRGDAENNLLRRAALLTLRSGYTHFAITAQDFDGRTYFFPIGDTYLHGPAYARRAGLWPEYPNVPETHYLASAEVTLLRPEEAAGNPQAIDARIILG